MTAREYIMAALKRVEKAEADGSFYLRVNSWLTAGDGRDFCAQAPDDIRILARMLEKAIEGLGPCMCGYERGCDYCETMEKLDAIAAGKEDL